MQKRVLVTGANGGQGGAVVKKLLTTDHTVRIFSRSGKYAENLPSREIEVATGSYDDSSSLGNALMDVDYVFLSYPVQFDTEMALNYCKAFVDAAKNSNVKLIVYNTRALYPDKEGSILLHDIRYKMEAVLKQASLPLVILRPTLYLDNFWAPWSLSSLLKDGILTYPVLENQPIAWTTHDMMAAYSVSAFEKLSLAGKRFDVGSYLLTGEDVANAFSSFLQKKVEYKFISPDVFEQKLALLAGEKTAHEVAESYRYIQTFPEHYAKDTTEELQYELPFIKTEFEEWLYAPANYFLQPSST